VELDLEYKYVLGVDTDLIDLIEVKNKRVEEAGKNPRNQYPLENEPDVEGRYSYNLILNIYSICGMAILVCICRVQA
jgi:hypothetical protein